MPGVLSQSNKGYTNTYIIKSNTYLLKFSKLT